MYISKLNHQGISWLNRLTVVQNNGNKNVGILNHNNHNDMASLSTLSGRTTSGKNLDMVLYSGEVVKSDIIDYTGQIDKIHELVPSAQRDYTVNDAINYWYNKEFEVNIFDSTSSNGERVKLRDFTAPIPQEFIDSLQQNGIKTEEYDSTWLKFYTAGLGVNSGELPHDVDYLASGYAVAKQNIESNLTGGEKADALTHLESEFDQVIKSVANKTAKEIGGFFEENKVVDETQKIYDSVINAYENRVSEYSDYIESNKDYAQLVGTENQWLESDNSYMACKLRKIEPLNKSEQTNTNDLYSLGELQQTQNAIKDIKSDINEIDYYNDEEQIGFKFGKVALKGEVFRNYADVSDSLKDAVNLSIEYYINNAVDKFNGELKKERAGLAEPEKVADLNKHDIFAVYNKMMGTYKATGDLIKSLQEGAVYGKNEHMNKIKNPEYSMLNRYGKDGSLYWQNFYQNTVKYKTDLNILGLPNLNNGYIQNESGIEALTKEWNYFASKFTNDKTALLNELNFSIYA